MISRRLLLGSSAAVVAAAAGKTSAATPSGPPTITELCADPAALDAAISPDGKTIAVLKQTVERTERDPDFKPFTVSRSFKVQKPDKYTATIALRATADVDTVRTIKLGALRTERIAWASDDLLLIWVTSGVLPFGIRRLAVLSRDGKTLRYLLEKDKDKAIARANADHGQVVDMLPDDPNSIMIQLRDTGIPTLYKLNIVDDVLTRVEAGNGLLTVNWYLQNGVPVVRRDRTGLKEISVMGRAVGETKWKLLMKQPVILDTPHEFEVLGAAEEPGVIHVTTYVPGQDAKALYEFDIRKNAWGKRVSQRNADVSGVVRAVGRRYLGASYIDDRRSFECLDPGLNDDLKALTEAFPTAAVQVRDISPDTQHLILKVSGPQQPGQFVYFNRTAGAVGLLDLTQPTLTENRLAPVELLDVKSTGGQMIRAYLTGAPGKNKPLVVVPHGGPEQRDQVGFDLFAQAFAAQGWLVVQPNFRGSSGYGRSFADAGRRNWNGVVMEDIEACIDTVISSGRADPARVAIFGWSFGGYASLMCGVRRPKAYKAVVSVAGVSDLMEIMKQERLAGIESESYKYWLKTVGDPAKEAGTLKAASPVEHAADMAAPVLLIHGRFDRTVDPEQSSLMNQALRNRDKQVEMVTVPTMAHSPSDRDDMVDILEKAVSFLKPKLA